MHNKLATYGVSKFLKTLNATEPKRALELVAAGQSYREVGLRLGISKNTVLDIVKRDRAKQATITG